MTDVNDTRIKSGLYTVYLEAKDGTLNTYTCMADGKRAAIISAIANYCHQPENHDKGYIPIEARIEEDEYKDNIETNIGEPEASLFKETDFE